MKTSTAIIVSLAIGAAMTIMLSAHVFTFTKDLSYFRIFGIESVNINKDTDVDSGVRALGWKYEGKEILNPPYSGFPMPVHRDCEIRALGMVNFAPRCENHSSLSFLALFINTVFWGAVAYGVVTLIRRNKKAKSGTAESKKE